MEVKAGRNYINKASNKPYLVTGISKLPGEETEIVYYKEIGNLSATVQSMPIALFKEKFKDAVSDRILP